MMTLGKVKNYLKTIIVIICSVIWLIDYFIDLPTKGETVWKAISLFSGLIATAVLGSFFVNKFYSKRKRVILNEYSPNVINEHFHTLANNSKNECEMRLKMIKTGIKLNYINIPCEYYKGGHPTQVKNYKSTIQCLSISNRLKGKNNSIIIGEGGAGKTTLIYDYIVKYISKSNYDKIPVYLSLASWRYTASDEVDFEQWLSKKIDEEYSIDEKIALDLIQEAKVIPCLDALDEVLIEFRSVVVTELLKYAKKGELIFSCKNSEFETLSSDFKVNFSVCRLKSLERKEVENALGSHYSDNLTKKLSEFEFIRTPLMLNVVASISSELSENEKYLLLKKERKDDILQIIWKKFDEITFKRKFSTDSKDLSVLLSIQTQKRLRFWLSWLSRYSQGRSSEFFIEQAQPSWINDNKGLLLYLIISRMLVGIILSISVGFFLSGWLDFVDVGIILGFVIGTWSYITYRKKDDSILISGKDVTKKVNVFNYNLLAERIKHLLMLTIISGLTSIAYLGFTVPRKPNDLILENTFALTESYVGIFITLFFASIFGLRNQWQSPSKDIRPVERIKVNWKQFLVKGLIGGLGLALFLFVCALFIDKFFQQSTFGIWLAEEGNKFYGLYGPYFGFIAGFLFGFPIFAVMGWLDDRKSSYSNQEKKTKELFNSNYGIKMSWKNAGIAFCLSALFFVVIFSSYIYLYTSTTDGLIKGIFEGIGASIVISLWFGGIDAIQHSVLRLIFYIRGYAPLGWKNFLRYGKISTIIRQSGASYSFYHRTLKDYYQNKRLEKNNEMEPITPNALTVWAFLLALCILSFSIFTGFDEKYIQKSYWKDINGGLTYDFPVDTIMSLIGNNSLKINSTGTLEIVISNQFKIGNFTGYIASYGTESGFLGFPIGDTYDTIKSQPHGAVLYKLSRDSTWSSMSKMSNFKSHASLFVDEEDTISFLVNDKEWHNNVGNLKVMLNIVSSEK